MDETLLNLLRAIEANPTDRLLRLVLADRLEESHDPALQRWGAMVRRAAHPLAPPPRDWTAEGGYTGLPTLRRNHPAWKYVEPAGLSFALDRGLPVATLGYAARGGAACVERTPVRALRVRGTALDRWWLAGDHYSPYWSLATSLTVCGERERSALWPLVHLARRGELAGLRRLKFHRSWLGELPPGPDGPGRLDGLGELAVEHCPEVDGQVVGELLQTLGVAEQLPALRLIGVTNPMDVALAVGLCRNLESLAVSFFTVELPETSNLLCLALPSGLRHLDLGVLPMPWQWVRLLSLSKAAATLEGVRLTPADRQAAQLLSDRGLFPRLNQVAIGWHLPVRPDPEVLLRLAAASREV